MKLFLQHIQYSTFGELKLVAIKILMLPLELKLVIHFIKSIRLEQIAGYKPHV